MTKLPLASALVKYVDGETKTHASMLGWRLQRIEYAPAFANARCLPRPGPAVPRSNFSLSGEKTL
jgi:hypothetical protein